VVGVAGTVTQLAAVALDLAAYSREAVDQLVMPTAQVHATVDRLLAMTVAERLALPAMHPGRADVIGAGGLIWSRILARVPVPDHVVSEADILHAIAAAIGR
jgi:exopolyphosphatase/guanosine-5'-triphosphate,3'-diphosphate pyrophosphatase